MTKRRCSALATFTAPLGSAVFLKSRLARYLASFLVATLILYAWRCLIRLRGLAAFFRAGPDLPRKATTSPRLCVSAPVLLPCRPARRHALRREKERHPEGDVVHAAVVAGTEGRS